MSYDQRLHLTTLVAFATQLSNAVCEPHNTRINNMAMLRALNAESMPEILNQTRMTEATVAYQGVLSVLTRVRLQIVLEDEDEDLDNLKLTYERFKQGLNTAKHHLLILNS